MPKALKSTLLAICIVLALLVIVIGGYIIYLETTYYRIADDTPIDVENNPSKTLEPGTSYKMAYTKDGTLREKQLALLCGILEKEAAAGNYVIVGGDWNHALGDSLELYESNYQPPTWVSEFDESLLPQGFSVVHAGNIQDVPTCRNNDEPYEKGHTYTVTVDGFVVSSNVKATAENVDTGFEYSDHNPVLLTFELE